MALLPDVPLGDAAGVACAAAILVIAYALFALAGFGSALIASAPLAWVLPVARIVPLLAVLDCTGSVSRAWQARTTVDRAALGRLLPGMLLGQIVGVGLLSALPAHGLALLLGGFVAGYGVWHALGRRGAEQATPTRAWLYGGFGGVLGGVFGSGGFAYAAYLQPRLERAAFRATQGVLIALSTAWRIALCAAAGLVDGRLVTTALVLLPAAWLGMALGARVDAGDSGADWVASVCLLKNHATQAMQFCADAAVQILGGMGYMRGTLSERVYREVKVMMIGGGAEEIMKELAARQWGL